MKRQKTVKRESGEKVTISAKTETVNSGYESLYDLFSYQNNNVSVDLKNMKAVYNLDVGGNNVLDQLNREKSNIDEIDKRFEVSVYISTQNLKHNLSSPTYGKDLKAFYDDLLKKHDIVTDLTKNQNSPASAKELYKLTPVILGEIYDRELEKAKIERFYRDLVKLKYVPKVKLKYEKLDAEKRHCGIRDAITMLENGQDLKEVFGKYFKADKKTEINLDDPYSGISESAKNLTAEKLETLEKCGFVFSSKSKKYAQIKTTKIFNSLGDDDSSDDIPF